MTFINAMVLSLYLSAPIVTLAQANIESTCNIYAKGDNGRSHGAFQVQTRYWGNVPDTFIEQARQCEKIRLSLDTNIWAAVQKYNGTGKKSKKYLWKVQRETIRIALM